MQLNVSAFLEKSRANGPGERSVVWVQGCPIHCTGCFNPDTWDFVPQNLMEVDELATRIFSVEGISGVSFSGGEPFAQAEALAALGEKLQARGLNVLVFTGYTLAQLESGIQPGWEKLLAVTDLLVAGPFNIALRADLPLRGSSNQELIFLTERLRNSPELLVQQGQLVEFIIDTKGNMIVTGFTEKNPKVIRLYR